MNNCDCKHASYCTSDPEKCTLSEEWKHFNSEKIFNRDTNEISSMQGHGEQDLDNKNFK